MQKEILYEKLHSQSHTNEGRKKYKRIDYSIINFVSI